MLGTMVHPTKDTVVVEGKTIKPFQDLVYVMFNKPPRIMTTMNDPDGRPSVADYFVKAKLRLFPVGRLDWDSEGLLILTNDGDFAQRVSHPKSSIPKTYLVKVDGQPTHEDLQKLMRGVPIVGGKAFALLAETVERKTSDKYDWIKVIINEGRNRQIRQMFEKIGYDVMKLQRVAIGRLRLGPLDKGKFRIMTDEDIARVFAEPKELDERDRKRKEYRRVHGLGHAATGGRSEENHRLGHPAKRPGGKDFVGREDRRPPRDGDRRPQRGGAPHRDPHPARNPDRARGAYRGPNRSPDRPTGRSPGHGASRGPNKFKRERDDRES